VAGTLDTAWIPLQLESYWSYELCHGKSIRQYHEEKDPASDDGISVTQDYTLGLYTKESGDLKKGQVEAEKSYTAYITRF